MQHTIFRLLIVLVLWCSADAVFASMDWDSNSGNALAHCEQASADEADRKNALYGPTYSCGGSPAGVCPTACTLSSNVSYSGCVGGCVGASGPAYRCTTRSNNGSGPASQCESPSQGIYGYHAYDPQAPNCEASIGDQITNYASATLPNYIQHGSVCKESCQYDVVVGTASQECTYDDVNSSGAPDDGDTYQCPATYQYNGTECSGGNTANETPDPQYYDCTNVDCSSDSGPGGGTGTNDGGGTTPGQDTGGNDNPSPGTGDGDPDTPTGGSGSGDVNGDGVRDIDCDPSSNPDCGYTGSGTGSGNCDVQPSCSGDPVQCAILYQEWAAMCYDGATLNNPENCNAPLVCEGDKLKCEIIRQQRQQYCDLYYGDGSQDIDVFNDTDFTNDPIGDLRADTTPTNLMDLIDITPPAGSCPAGIDTSVYGVAIQFSLQPFCDLAPFIRALVLISAWLSAVLMVLGVERK